MKPDWKPHITTHFSAVTSLAKSALQKSYSFALGLLIVLGLAALAPSAQGQTFTSLYSFAGGTDGTQPLGLVRDKAGNLYGATLYGGGGRCNFNSGCGTVFKLDASGHETLLHAFTGGRDGVTPQATLILDPSGNLYGATLTGGNLQCGYIGGCGTVFEVNISGNKTVLYYFPENTVAESPDSLTRDAQGNFYGTTTFGSGWGTVFKLDSTHQLTVLHGFAGAPSDGRFPYGALTRDNAGNLFGTTFYGGVNDSGTIYKIDSTGKETVLYSFTSTEGNPSGLTPVGQNFYGTSSSNFNGERSSSWINLGRSPTSTASLAEAMADNPPGPWSATEPAISTAQRTVVVLSARERCSKWTQRRARSPYCTASPAKPMAAAPRQV